uniref:Uncharacterized protein n=1 Tax=Plectus sambesii TaxID=2011161 RepID=A0A914VVI0_9BILA
MLDRAGCDAKTEHLTGGTLNIVFKLVLMKHKIRLELVSRRVRQHAQSFTAWSLIKSVVITDERDKFCRINNIRVPLHVLSPAVRCIISRCWNIRLIDLRLSSNPIAHSAVAEAVVCNGVGSLRKLTHLSLDGQNSFEVSSSILALINVLKRQLRYLHFFGIHNSSAIDALARLWELVGECVNLRTLIYFGMRYTIASASEAQLREMITTALLNKPIRRLCLTTECIKTDEMVQIISSLANDHSLYSLEVSSYLVTLPDLFHKLSPVHWTGVRHFRYSHTGVLDGASPAWSGVLSLPLLFPRLKSLMLLICWFQLSVHQVVDMILTYLSHLNARGSRTRSSTALKLTLFSLAMHARDRTEVLRSLADDYNCELEMLADDEHHCRIRCGRSGNGCIELFYLCDR